MRMENMFTNIPPPRALWCKWRRTFKNEGICKLALTKELSITPSPSDLLD